MGNNVTIEASGSLSGAHASSTTAINTEHLPKRYTKKFKATIPPTGAEARHKTKNAMYVTIAGKTEVIDIPMGMPPGTEFFFEHEVIETHKVYASTLPAIPGFEVVQMKPIIYGSTTFTYNSFAQSSMGDKMGQLLKRTQVTILERTIDVECNACLGMTFNVTTDSSGERGTQKSVIITACGTPCVVIPTAESAVVLSDSHVSTVGVL